MAISVWRVEKRVANTDYWGAIARVTSRDEAISKARSVIGGVSTGVRIVRDDDPYDEPETIVGV